MDISGSYAAAFTTVKTWVMLSYNPEQYFKLSSRLLYMYCLLCYYTEVFHKQTCTFNSADEESPL